MLSLQQHYHHVQQLHFDQQQHDADAVDQVQLRRKSSAEEQARVVSGLLSRPSFVNSLNAKLAQQQQQHQCDGGSGMAETSAIKIRQLVADANVPDPAPCHESLMDQIRRGTSLRRSRATNDRSSPKI